MIVVALLTIWRLQTFLCILSIHASCVLTSAVMGWLMPIAVGLSRFSFSTSYALFPLLDVLCGIDSLFVSMEMNPN
jgi:hypothetical protein